MFPNNQTLPQSYYTIHSVIFTMVKYICPSDCPFPVTLIYNKNA
ncbi:hypothetical protein CLOBOL_01953 [Enterocloster bolteae ATCC BAA-613]|uniref:Uncharacterized protein n=1 Tax=Enterocloster bolteae (strain ATCC BAA-613 / DSM 15670 / CCUG 46953 / JCM 12243 / WAL 16351) TaxID=411902 RepID=A8RMM0_ENTBW|nr:hypothetical protein CLOBOL_01953 [Enterocloster bolteae ATCC BAA-613]